MAEWIWHSNVILQMTEFCTCSGCWTGVAHVGGSRGRALVESILLGRGWVRIAGRSRWRWAIAIHHSRRRIAVRCSTVLCRSSTRSWNTAREKGYRGVHCVCILYIYSNGATLKGAFSDRPSVHLLLILLYRFILLVLFININLECSIFTMWYCYFGEGFQYCFHPRIKEYLAL